MFGGLLALWLVFGGLFCFPALMTEIYFTLECQDSLGCAGSLNEPSVLGVKHALFELELQFSAVCASPARLSLGCHCGAACARASLEFEPLLLHLAPLIFLRIFPLVTFHHHSLLIPNLILTCLRVMKTLAEPHSKD